MVVPSFVIEFVLSQFFMKLPSQTDCLERHQNLKEIVFGGLLVWSGISIQSNLKCAQKISAIQKYLMFKVVGTMPNIEIRVYFIHYSKADYSFEERLLWTEYLIISQNWNRAHYQSHIASKHDPQKWRQKHKKLYPGSADTKLAWKKVMYPLKYDRPTLPVNYCSMFLFTCIFIQKQGKGLYQYFDGNFIGYTSKLKKKQW